MKKIKLLVMIKYFNMKHIAKFTKEIKQEIFERDKLCIICWKPWTDFHHVFYGQDSNYNEDRNNSSQWVLLCKNCHKLVHGCKRWEWTRKQCIDYLLNK